MSYLLGIDLGTTSVKCVLFDQGGGIVASGRSEYELSMPRPEYVEVEAETYWKAMKGSLEAALGPSKAEAKDIHGIGVSSQGETFIALGEDGRPLGRAIVWLDNRAREEARLIEGEFGSDEVYRITGQNEIVPTWTATKILWLRRNEPLLFERVNKYLMLEDYVIYRLTGEFATEHSILSSSMLFDINHGKWWGEMLHFLGIDEDRLPEPIQSGVPVGNLTPEAAKETGLPTSSIVSTGAYDQAANAIGAGNIEPGVITETTGAAMALVATTDRIILDPMRRMPCHHHAVRGRYFLQPWCQTAGTVLRWYRDNFGMSEVEAAKETGADPYDLLTAEASGIAPGSDGLILLPHFMGAASPESNPDAKGVLFGLTPYHGKGHFVRAIMESVAYMLRRNVELLEELGIEVREIRSTGGASKSALWNQIKADVLQKPILAVRGEEVAALGVAMLAGVATGAFASLEDAVKSMVSLKGRLAPSQANGEIYDERYKRYVELYDSVKGLF